jgi:hypothetical protein
MKHLLFLLIAATFSLTVVAQQAKKTTSAKKEKKRERKNALIRQEEEGVIAYKKHFAVGGKLITDGYGLFFEKGKGQSVKKSLLFQLEIAERKYNKEEKENKILSPSSPVIFGKLNFFYPVKVGVQQQFLLGNKSNKNGVSVTGNVGGGLSIALLRPYELQITDTAGQQRWVKYDSPDSLLFVNGFLDPRTSGPNLGKGWDGLKITPGIYTKAAVRFDYGAYNEMINAIEVGVCAEFYSKKIPQMLYNKEKQFFFSAYFSLMFGKRKGK